MLVIVAIGYLGLLGLSFALGLASLGFARRTTIWKALGLWGLGLGAGIAGMLLALVAFRLAGQERAAMIAAGKSVPINDMPGFGLVMLGWLGLLYFAALLAILTLAFAVATLRRGRDGG